MLIQWLVLTDKGWMEVGDAPTHRAFTEAFQQRAAQVHNFRHVPDLYQYTWHVPWTCERFDYAVDFRTMEQTNVHTGTTRPIRMQIVEVNTLGEARSLLAVARDTPDTPPHGGGGGADRWGSTPGGGGERWSTARSST